MEIVGRTHHMLVSVWGSRWKDVYLSFFTAYVDDSGSDAQQKVANATALIIPAARIIALEKEWEALKKKEGFSRWHTSEFVARERSPDSEFANWDDEKHDRVFTRVRQICKKYGVQPMSFSIKKEDYDDVVPDWFRQYSGLYHYTWAIRHILAHTVAWRVQRAIPHPLEYVFDWMGEKRRNLRRQEIEDVMFQAEETASDKGMSGEYLNWSFRCSREVPGLQCVDALAWCVYQYGQFEFYGRPLIRDAQIAWDDFGKYLGGKWGFDVTVTRENLKKWIEQEIADGTSLRRFKELEEKQKSAKGNRIQSIRQCNDETRKGIAQRDKSKAGRGEGSQEKAEA